MRLSGTDLIFECIDGQERGKDKFLDVQKCLQYLFAMSSTLCREDGKYTKTEGTALAGGRKGWKEMTLDPTPQLSLENQ